MEQGQANVETAVPKNFLRILSMGILTLEILYLRILPLEIVSFLKQKNKNEDFVHRNFEPSTTNKVNDIILTTWSVLKDKSIFLRAFVGYCIKIKFYLNYIIFLLCSSYLVIEINYNIDYFDHVFYHLTHIFIL